MRERDDKKKNIKDENYARQKKKKEKEDRKRYSFKPRKKDLKER
jgi:hypothetical protein